VENAIPTNTDALIAIGIIAVLTPYLTAFLTKPGAPSWITGPVSGIVTGAGAVCAYLFDVNGVPDWRHVAGLFVVAVAAAQGFRKGIEPGIEKSISARTSKFGVQ
jgi:hypothetical protein